MKDSIRLFVAVTLPPELKELLQEQLRVYEHPSLRFVPAQNLHLTLFFIGNVPEEQLPGITQHIRHIAAQTQPFTLNLEQIEPGPARRQPRLVWARFTPHPSFETLSYKLTEALAQQPVKKQKPIPHVTLARFRKDKQTPEKLPVVPATAPVQLHIQEITLWQSKLASPHPVYSELESFALATTHTT